MPISQLRAAPLPNQSLADNSTPDALAGRAGEALATQLHGKYYTQVYRGNVFIGSTAIAGVKLPISTTTTHVFAVWNPAGSLKNLVPLKLYAGLLNDTTAVAGHIVYQYKANVGTVVGAASQLTTFTSATIVNANLGAGVQSVAKFAALAGAVVIDVAATFLKNAGINQLATSTTSSTTQMQWTTVEEFEGTLIIPPNTLFCVSANAALLNSLDLALVWEEVPV
jgi:hypothetical protein